MAACEELVGILEADPRARERFVTSLVTRGVPGRRALIIWYSYRGMAHKEIGRAMGISPSTVKNQTAFILEHFPGCQRLGEVAVACWPLLERSLGDIQREHLRDWQLRQRIRLAPQVPAAMEQLEAG